MTTRNIYKEAILVQDAVNLSGVAHALSEAVSEIWREARAIGEDTEYVNTHPVVRLFLEKLTQLNMKRGTTFEEAYQVCKTRAELAEKCE